MSPVSCFGYDRTLAEDHIPAMTTIIAIGIQKGGTGKSTTTVNLGAALVEAGRRVLLVDMDPQASCTAALGFDLAQVNPSIADVLADGMAHPLQGVVLATGVPGLELAPAHLNLAALEATLLSEFRREDRLKTALLGLPNPGYDYVLIDCPPSLTLLTVNVLNAARWVLVPLLCHALSLQALPPFLTVVEKVRRSLNPNLAVMGLLPSIYDSRTKEQQNLLTELQDHWSGRVFPPIRASTRVAEASHHGVSLLQYKPRSPVADAYRLLAQEVMAFG
jgi:chromosome partitioning protein